MSDELDKALGELNDTYAKYRSPQVPKEGLPEEISKTPMPEASPGTKASPGASLDDLVGELNRSLPTPKPAEKPIGIPERKGWTEGPVGMGIGGNIKESFQEIPKQGQKVADLLFGKGFGIEKEPGETTLEKATRILEPSPEQRAGMEELSKTIPGQVLAGAARTPAILAQFMGAGGALKAAAIPELAKSILTFAGVQAFGDIGNKSAWEIVKKLPEAVIMGGVFHYLGPAFKEIKPGGMDSAGKILEAGGVEITRGGQTRTVKAAVLGTLFAGQALYDGGDIKQAVSSGLTMAMLSLTSGGKKEKGTYETGKGKLLSMSERMKQTKEFREGFGAESEGPGVIPDPDVSKFTERYRTWGDDSMDLESGEESVKMDPVSILEASIRNNNPEEINKLVKKFEVDIPNKKIIVTTNNDSTVDIEINKNGKFIGKDILDPDGNKLDKKLNDLELRKLFGLPDNKTSENTRKDVFPKTVEDLEPAKIPVRGVKKDTVKKIDIFDKSEAAKEIEIKGIPKPLGEPSETLLPPTSAPGGEGFKMGDKVIYDGKEYLVNEVDPNTKKVSIYIEGKGESIKEVDPGELKAPETKLRAGEAGRDDEPITPKIADRVVQLFNDVAGDGLIVTLTPEIKKDLAITEALRQGGMTDVEAKGATVKGTYNRGTMRAFARVVMDKEAPVSALHEIFHFLEDFKLMDTERNELKGWEPDGEKRAEKLANIMHRDLYGGVKSMLPESIRKIVVKLENFIKDFGKFLKGEGYGPKDVDKIIRDIETGEIGKRRVRETPLPQGLVPLELDTARDQIIRARGETEQTTDRGKTATKLGVSPEDLDYVGVQDFNNQRLHLWNLKKAVPGHPEGSTITSGEWYGKEATKLRVAKDVEKEIKDDLRGATKTMGGVTDALKRAFAPGTRGDIAKTTVTDMGRELARHERDLGVFLKATEKATRGFDRMSTEEQYQFSQNASTGKPQANGILDAIEDHVQRVFTDVGNGINKLAERIGYTKEDELLHMRDDYWPGVEEETWRAKEGVKPAPIQGSRVFEPTGFMKQKVFQDFNERIAAGYIPKDPNPIRGQALPKLAQESKVYYTYKMIADTMDNGNAVIIKPGESVEPGWRAVPGPYGNTKIGGKLIMTDQAAQVFENWLSRPLASNKYVGPIYKAYMNITTALQRAQLFGLFHGGFMVGESVTGTGALALKQAYRVMTGEENIGTFLKTAISVPFAPFIKYKMGAEIRAELETPGTSKDPRVIKAVEDIMRGGGGISQEKMFTNYWTESMKQSFKEGRNIAGAFKSPFAGMEFLMKPLMQKFVPNLKLGAFEELSNELQKAKPNLSDAAYNTEMREIWNRIDSRLGQVRWQRLFMNNTAKNLIQMIIRAPGWTGGTIMEIGGAPIDVFRFVREWQKTGRPAALPDRVAYVLSLAATTMVTNAALTCLFAKKNPNELTSEDYMAFQTGDIDERGKPLRGMLPLYSKDIYAYKKSFVSTLWHKTNPIIGLIYELTQNKDYYGTGIIDPTKGQGEKIGELGKYLAKSLIPFGYRGGAKISEERGVTPEGVLMPIVGIMPAPAYFSQSKATQKALEFGALKMPSGGRTQEDFERNKLLNGHVKRYLSAMSKGEPTEDVLKRLGEDVQSGKLKQQDIMKFKTKIKGQSLESSVTRLSIDQAMAVWRVATDEEKRKIVPLIFKKYRNLKDPRDKQEYASEMEKISGDLSKIYNLEK